MRAIPFFLLSFSNLDVSVPSLLLVLYCQLLIIWVRHSLGCKGQVRIYNWQSYSYCTFSMHWKKDRNPVYIWMKLEGVQWWQNRKIVRSILLLESSWFDNILEAFIRFNIRAWFWFLVVQKRFVFLSTCEVFIVQISGLGLRHLAWGREKRKVFEVH